MCWWCVVGVGTEQTNAAMAEVKGWCGMKEWMIAGLVVVGIFGAAVGIPVSIFIFTTPDPVEHAFVNGDFVATKIDGRVGMVIAVYRYESKYGVRFTCAEQVTNTRILSDDRAIENAPYAVVVMREYELTEKLVAAALAFAADLVSEIEVTPVAGE